MHQSVLPRKAPPRSSTNLQTLGDPDCISNLLNTENYTSELPGKLHFPSLLSQCKVTFTGTVYLGRTDPNSLVNGREATSAHPGLQHITVCFSLAAKSRILSIKTFHLKITQWQTLQLRFSVGDIHFPLYFPNAEGPVCWSANGSQQRPKRSLMSWKNKAV